MIDHKELLEYLHYDPDTGEFTRRKKSRSGPSNAGRKAGWVHKRTGYISLSIHNVSYSAHRLAWFYMTGEWPPGEIDHINGVKSDNRWSNLRECLREQNCCNRRINSNNKSGVSGVYWYAPSKKWRAVIRHNWKLHYLGQFPTKRGAVKARKDAEKRLFGDFRHAV